MTARYTIELDDEARIVIEGQNALEVKRLAEQVLNLVSNGKEITVVHRPLPRALLDD